MEKELMSAELSKSQTQSVSNGVSVYRDRLCNDEDIKKAILLLKSAFPRMGEDFFVILTMRIKANKFTAKRLTDAVNHSIDTIVFKDISVADIISFDKRVKTYTRSEVLAMGAGFPNRKYCWVFGENEQQGGRLISVATAERLGLEIKKRYDK